MEKFGINLFISRFGKVGSIFFLFFLFIHPNSVETFPPIWKIWKHLAAFTTALNLVFFPVAFGRFSVPAKWG